MQPVPPPQPTMQPTPPHGQRPPAGWGRFWIGVVTGGCAVLALEAIALLVVTLVIGSAINGFVRQGGGGAGLPGRLPLPSGLPGLSQPSDPCSPAPCVAHGGVTVLIAGVDRNVGPASDAKSHLVRLKVTFVATSGTHSVTPEAVAIRDSTGSMTLAGVDQAAAACGDDATASTDLSAGQRAGPFTLCYAVDGASSAPLTLVWIDPEDLSVVELKLP